jgi:hypothetical protein
VRHNPEDTVTLSDMLPNDLPPTVRATRLASLLMLTPRTLLNMVKRGDLPAPARPSPRIAVFLTQEVRDALARLDAERAKEGAVHAAI